MVCPFLLRLNINSTLSDLPQNQQPVNFSTSNNLKTARSAHHNSEFRIPNSEFNKPPLPFQQMKYKNRAAFLRPCNFISEYYLLLNEGILGRIQHALGLVESDVLDTEVTEQVEQELSVVAERYRAVVRITLLN